LLRGGTGFIYGFEALNGFSSMTLIVICSLRFLFELFRHGEEHAAKLSCLSFFNKQHARDSRRLGQAIRRMTVGVPMTTRIANSFVR
jgi:hypothetical protein